MLYGLTAYQCVLEFHKTFRSPVADKPQELSQERYDLRIRLIQEELAEFMEAVEEGDFYNSVKELADLLYVVNGTAVEMGLDGDDIVQLVHQSNMTKLDEDGHPIFREDGKVLKGPNYKPVTQEMVKLWLES
jgi:predicted HAD superfamily Cof-like phosphohydrolase